MAAAAGKGIGYAMGQSFRKAFVPHTADSNKATAPEVKPQDQVSEPSSEEHEKADERHLENVPTETGMTDEEKAKVEQHRTISRVPGNPNYYEKDGLRTYGDGEDHDHEPPLTFRRFMIFTAMSFLWTGSQIPVYMYGGIIPIIMADIGGADRYVWIILGNLIPLATVCPFVGALSDLFGRRNLALGGSVFLIVGNVVCATAHTMNVFIGGQVLCGVGAGVLELTALAATGELAPTSKRGFYVGAVIITILPYCPSVLYAQEVCAHAGWRYVGLWLGLWSFTGFILVAFFYFPPPRVNSQGLTRREILKRIDYVGGLLSAAGLTLFLAGLTWAGNQYTWHSPHVLACIILGPILLGIFVIWEIWFVEFPMWPSRLKTNLRAMLVICIITFVTGANFFAVLIFWPEQYFFVYAGNDPVSTGVGSLPVGFGIIGGSVIVAIFLTILKGKIRLFMIIGCVMMTAGSGAMAAATQQNLNHIYIAISFACVGVGAVIIPNQIIASIVCPDDLIATATALTISLRTIGGCIGFSIYYNILRTKFTEYAKQYIAIAAVDAGVGSYKEIYNIAFDLAANLRSAIPDFPHINTYHDYITIVHAGQKCFALAFPRMWYATIAFGGVAVIASVFMPDLGPFMDDHVAVVIH